MRARSALLVAALPVAAGVLAVFACTPEAVDPPPMTKGFPEDFATVGHSEYFPIDAAAKHRLDRAVAGVGNLDCNACHGGGATFKEFDCATCHRDTPSHALETTLPAGHTPGMNCRQCHGPGLSQPFPHVDNGDDCNDCHQ